MKNQFLLSSASTEQAPPLSNQITRRASLKRTGGATVAVIVASHLAVQRAEAQMADGGSGSSWYDMSCIEPSSDVGDPYTLNVAATATCPAQSIRFELIMQSDKLADIADVGYDYCAFNHTFILRAYDVTGGGEIWLNQVTCLQRYDVSCDRNNGKISAYHYANSSSPPGSGDPPLVSSPVSFATCGQQFTMSIIVFEPSLSPNNTDTVQIVSIVQGHVDIATNGVVGHQSLTLPSSLYSGSKLLLYNQFRSKAHN